jgi:hypothetical protein
MRDIPTKRRFAVGYRNAEDLVVHVSGSRPTPHELVREIADVAIALPLFPITPLLRPWHARWRATDAEVTAPLPGDDSVPGCQYVVTRAVTICQ